MPGTRFIYTRMYIWVYTQVYPWVYTQVHPWVYSDACSGMFWCIPGHARVYSRLPQEYVHT